MEERKRTSSSARSTGSRRSPAGEADAGSSEFGSTAAGETGSRSSSSSPHENGGHGFAERIRESASAQLSSQKERATDGLGSIAQAVRQSTQQLREQHHDTVAQYVEQAANQIERWSTQLREKDLGELVEDAQRLARRQPAIFIGSAFALGLLSARFLKSSPNRAPHQDWRRSPDVYGRSEPRHSFRPATGVTSTGTSPATETFNG